MRALFLLLCPALLCGQTVLVVTAHGEDYVLCAGGTLAGMVQKGARAYVIRVTNDEKTARGITPEEAAMRTRAESEEAGKVLGVKEVISLGYRAGELGAVSPTELRDRMVFFIRQHRPDILFLPNPYTHYDDELDHQYAGSAAEEAGLAAGLRNFQPPHAQAALAAHVTRQLYYYALPLDPERNRPESTATFVPQPKRVDITPTLEVKVRAIAALKTRNRALADDVSRRLARSGKTLPHLDNLAETQARNLGTAEEFLVR